VCVKLWKTEETLTCDRSPAVFAGGFGFEYTFSACRADAAMEAALGDELGGESLNAVSLAADIQV
jgi:hypothetical protein